MTEFDQLLDKVGGFGKWQKTVVIISFLSSFICAFNHYSPIFLAYKPKFECAIDSNDGRANECVVLNGTLEIPCTSWKYDTSVMKSSVVTEYDLVCDKLPLLSTITSSYMGGVRIFKIVYINFVIII